MEEREIAVILQRFDDLDLMRAGKLTMGNIRHKRELNELRVVSGRILRVHIIRAKVPLGKWVDKYLDTFVVVKVGACQKRTRVIINNNNPIFDEMLEFDAVIPFDRIQLKVLDMDWGSSEVVVEHEWNHWIDWPENSVKRITDQRKVVGSEYFLEVSYAYTSCSSGGDEDGGL